MQFRKNFFVILIYFLSINYSHSIEADIFVQSTVNRASKILSENLSKEKKIEKLKNIAKETVDIKAIGMYTLGATRKNLNDDQKTKYSDIFEKYFLKSFSSRLAEYTNPEIDVYGKEILNEKYTIVNSLLKGTSERPEVKIDWRIYTKDPNNPLIRDLIIEGLSLARTQKEEFTSILNSNNSNINSLFETLENLAKNLKKTDDEKFTKFYKNLLKVNNSLWIIEDEIRILEKKQLFNKDFISLARSVYIENDKRFEIKNEINMYFKSDVVEQKQYIKYN